jgi:squalene synthase HpnC
VGHYENFPVASWLCPPRLRPPVRAIYAFARTADDLADEGHAAPAERLDALARYRAALHRVAAGSPVSPDAWPQVFGPLQRELRAHALPLPLLDDLLDAFMQDVGNPVYAQRSDLLDYCRRSANPIGRLLLHLYGVNDPLALTRSDAVCSALQLINFWQDLSVDLPRGRTYLPTADLRRHGLDITTLSNRVDDASSQALVRDLCDWAGGLMRQGAPLALQLPGRVGWELRLVVQGGLRVLDRIAAMQYRSLRQRPTIGAADLLPMAWRALTMSAHAPMPQVAP